jgi:ferritin-like metal-binding protein YciE
VGLKDIYYAEKILSKTLPKMAKNASTPELTTINKHLTKLMNTFQIGKNI